MGQVESNLTKNVTRMLLKKFFSKTFQQVPWDCREGEIFHFSSKFLAKNVRNIELFNIRWKPHWV